MDRALTLNEVASLLKVHPSTIYKLLKRGQIPAFKIGVDWRFDRGSIDLWIQEREAAERV
jgi:excisionase family DNA binding protein